MGLRRRCHEHRLCACAHLRDAGLVHRRPDRHGLARPRCHDGGVGDRREHPESARRRLHVPADVADGRSAGAVHRRLDGSGRHDRQLGLGLRRRQHVASGKPVARVRDDRCVPREARDHGQPWREGQQLADAYRVDCPAGRLLRSWVRVERRAVGGRCVDRELLQPVLDRLPRFDVHRREPDQLLLGHERYDDGDDGDRARRHPGLEDRQGLPPAEQHLLPRRARARLRGRRLDRRDDVYERPERDRRRRREPAGVRPPRSGRCALRPLPRPEQQGQRLLRQSAAVQGDDLRARCCDRHVHEHFTRRGLVRVELRGRLGAVDRYEPHAPLRGARDVSRHVDRDEGRHVERGVDGLRGGGRCGGVHVEPRRASRRLRCRVHRRVHSGRLDLRVELGLRRRDELDPAEPVSRLQPDRQLPRHAADDGHRRPAGLGRARRYRRCTVGDDRALRARERRRQRRLGGGRDDRRRILEPVQQRLQAIDPARLGPGHLLLGDTGRGVRRMGEAHAPGREPLPDRSRWNPPGRLLPRPARHARGDRGLDRLRRRCGLHHRARHAAGGQLEPAGVPDPPGCREVRALHRAQRAPLVLRQHPATSALHTAIRRPARVVAERLDERDLVSVELR